MDELDFGTNFVWRTDAEDDLMDQLDATFPSKGTASQIEAWEARQTKARFDKIELEVVPGPAK